MDIRIRPYQKGDEKDLNVMLKTIYNKEVNDEYWWWKYLNNPLGFHFAYCTLLEDRVIGFAGGIPYRIQYQGQEIRGAQLTDLMVDPTVRNKNIFSPIKKASTADIMKKMDIMYGFTNENSYKIYARTYDVAYKVPRMDKVLNVGVILRDRIKIRPVADALGSIGNFGLRIFNVLKSSFTAKGLAIKEINEFDERYDDFWKNISRHFKIAHIRDHRYLNWRYKQHPLFRYTAYAVQEENNILGYVVLKDDPGKIHRGLVMEFLAFQDRQDVQNLLLVKTVDHFSKLGADHITCWMFPHAPYYKAFRRHLFFPHSGNLIVLTTSYNEQKVSKEYLKDPLNWYVSYGDDDSF